MEYLIQTKTTSGKYYSFSCFTAPSLESALIFAHSWKADNMPNMAITLYSEELDLYFQIA